MHHTKNCHWGENNFENWLTASLVVVEIYSWPFHHQVGLYGVFWCGFLRSVRTGKIFSRNKTWYDSKHVLQNAREPSIELTQRWMVEIWSTYFKHWVDYGTRHIGQCPYAYNWFLLRTSSCLSIAVADCLRCLLIYPRHCKIHLNVFHLGLNYLLRH